MIITGATLDIPSPNQPAIFFNVRRLPFIRHSTTTRAIPTLGIIVSSTLAESEAASPILASTRLS